MIKYEAAIFRAMLSLLSVPVMLCVIGYCFGADKKLDPPHGDVMAAMMYVYTAIAVVYAIHSATEPKPRGKHDKV